MAKVLALDVGESRVGLAMTDDLGMLAIPMGFVERSEAIAKIIELVKNESPGQVVVGMPYLPSGEEGSQVSDVRKFVLELQGSLPTPIEFENEVYSSQEAEARLKAIGKPYQKGDIDAMAAAVILESFLNRRGRVE